jgi:DNA-binding GntR family transcriptional regulator
MFTTVLSETRLCLGALTGTYAGREDLVEEHERIAERIRDEDAEAAIAVLKTGFDDAAKTLKRRRGDELADIEAG